MNTETLKEEAAEVAQQAKENAQQFASAKKAETAGRIDRYGRAIHESARAIEQEDPNIAWLTHQAADRLQGVADYIRQRDFAELKDDAARIARRHPGAFLGGMFVAGIVLGSLVKAHRPADLAGEAGA